MLLRWIREKLRPRPLGEGWSVAIADDFIVTSDETGDERRLPIRGLRSVVVATDDSGPWGYDVVFLLYSELLDPVGIFPLEASGCEEFVQWLAKLPGYEDRELAKAMASTSVARFVVWTAES